MNTDEAPREARCTSQSTPARAAQALRCRAGSGTLGSVVTSNTSPAVTLLLIGRDDWRKDTQLNATLLARLRHLHLKIIWEEPTAMLLQWIHRFETMVPLGPKGRWWALKSIQLAYGAFHPGYLAYLYRLRHRMVETRCEGLKQLLRQQGDASRVVVLSRSAGGRIASLIADEVGFGHVVCLGYPFKHPDHPDEPARYRHLATLQTPMLILQGTQDAYGGLGLEHRYTLSPRIQLHYVDTEHDFSPLDEQQVDEVVNHIEAAVRSVAGGGARQQPGLQGRYISLQDPRPI